MLVASSPNEQQQQQPRPTPGPLLLCPYSAIKSSLQSPGSSPRRRRDGGTAAAAPQQGGAGGPSEDDVILTPFSVAFYRYDVRREALFWLLALLTGGLSLLVCKWYASLYARLRYTEVSEQDLSARVVVAVSLDGHHSVCPLHYLDPQTLTWRNIPPSSTTKSRGSSSSSITPDTIRAFIWRYERFWYDSSSLCWVRRAFDAKRTYKALHKMGADRLLETAAPAEATTGGSSSSSRARIRHATYGPNQTDIQVPPYYMMVVEEALKPFFAFQVFSLGVWFAQQYVTYAWSILFMTSYSVLANAWAEWRNLTELQALAKSDGVVERVVLVTGGGDTEENNPPLYRVEQVSTSSLLPGDIIALSPNLIMPCDAVLLAGHAILSEAMLTGESAPVMKAALPLDQGEGGMLKPDSDRDKKFLLFSGTKVLQAKCGPPPTRLAAHQPPSQASYVWELTNPPAAATGKKAGGGGTTQQQGESFSSSAAPALCMVCKTGFSTARGQLVRAILFPPPPKFDFEKQGYKFMYVLLTFLVVGAIVQIIIYRMHNETFQSTLMDLLNLVTIAVPPALPLSLSIGLQVSYNRLKQKGIFCSHTRSVAAAGRVNCLCFDKTGTLTEDGLTLHSTQVVEGGLLPSSSSSSVVAGSGGGGGRLGPALHDTETMYERQVVQQDAAAAATATGGGSSSSQLLQLLERPEVVMSLVMAACHSVSLLEGEAPAPPAKNNKTQQALTDLEGGDLEGGISLSDKDHQQRPSEDSVGGAFLTSSVTKSSSGHHHGGGGQHRRRPSSFSVAEPSSPHHNKKALVGDSLEVALLLRSGWRFCPRPHGDQQQQQQSGGGVGVAGAFDPVNIWTHPHMPPGVDTVLLPPVSVSSSSCARALAIVRRLDFDTDLRRMGVIIKLLTPPPPPQQSSSSSLLLHGHHEDDDDDDAASSSPLLLLVKGAPESLMAQDVCVPASLPTNLQAELHRHTSSGFRVLACAAKVLGGGITEATISSRADLERGLGLVGLLSMENRLKPQTVPHLSKYRAAAFRIIMITGDNPATAAAVGRMAGSFLDSPAHLGPLLLDVCLPPSPSSYPYLCLTDLSRPEGGQGGGGRRPLSLRTYLDRCFQHAGPSKARSVLATDTRQEEIMGPGGGSYRAEAAVVAVTGGEEEEAAMEEEGEGGEGWGEVWKRDVVVTGRAFEALQRAHQEIRGDDKGAGQGGHHSRQDGARWTALELLLCKANIFARMSPQHKQDLVRALQDVGLVVCMTGDGANDSGALKAGDIGISIAAVGPDDDSQSNSKQGGGGPVVVSAVEAAVLAAPSIAAPFATGIHHIGAVGTVLAEGRCALVTSVTMFKFMFLYGLIQFTGVLILYALLLELAANQYLWADMGVVLGLVMLVPTMAPRAFVQRGRPETNLVSVTILRSVMGHTILVITFQVLQQVMLSQQSWYVPSRYNKSAVDPNHIPVTVEATSKFIFSNYQYLFCCLAFCQTYGLFRKPVYRNKLLCAYFALQFVLSTIYCFFTSAALREAFTLAELPPSYRTSIFFLAFANGLVSMLYERYCVPQRSDDEEPVGPPTSYLPTGGGLSRSSALASLAIEMEMEMEAEGRDCPAMDKQPTLLPKLRAAPPIYHQIANVWARAGGGRL